MDQYSDKKLKFKMPDKSVWQIPAFIVAMDRAAAFARQGQPAVQWNDEIYDKTYKETIADDHLLREWAQRMDWEKDVKHHATMLQVTDTDYGAGWKEAEKIVVE